MSLYLTAKYQIWIWRKVQKALGKINSTFGRHFFFESDWIRVQIGTCWNKIIFLWFSCIPLTALVCLAAFMDGGWKCPEEVLMHLSWSWLLFGQVMKDLRAYSSFQGWESQRWKCCLYNWEVHIIPKGQHNWLPLSQGTTKPSKWFKCMSEEPSSLKCGIALSVYMWGFQGSDFASVAEEPSTWNCKRRENEIGSVQISYKARFDSCPFPIFWKLNVFGHLWNLYLHVLFCPCHIPV